MSTRKTIAFLLALLMCASIVLASCGKKDDDNARKADIEADPVGEVVKAVSETSSGIARSLTPLDPIRAAKNAGTVTLSLDNDALGVKVDAKTAYDLDAKKAAASLALSADKQTVTLKFNADNGKIAVAVPEFSEDTFGLDLNTFVDDLKENEFLKSYGVDIDEVAEKIEPMIETIGNIGKDDNTDTAKLEEAKNKLFDDLKARLNQCEHTIEKKDAEVGGESVGVFEVVFDIKKADLVDLFGIFKNDAKDIFAEMKNIYVGIIDKITSVVPDAAKDTPDIDELFDYDSFAKEMDRVIKSIEEDESENLLSFKVYLGQKDAELLFAELIVKSTNEKSTSELLFSIDLGADPKNTKKINGKTETKIERKDGDNEFTSAAFKIERSDDEKNFVIKLSTETKNGVDENDLEYMNNFACEFNNDKSAKTFTLSLTSLATYTYGGETEGTAVDLMMDGDMEYDERNLYFSVDSVRAEVDGDTKAEYDGIGLSVKISADADIPEMPDFKNIAAITEADVLSIAADAQKNGEDIGEVAGKVGEAISELFASSTSSLDYDDWDLDDDDWDVDDDDWDLDDDDDDDDDGEDKSGKSDKKVTYLDICDNFYDNFDYNMDGVLDDKDKTEWEEMFKPFGSTYDPTFDYDDDGEVGTAEDKSTYQMFFGFAKDIEVNLMEDSDDSEDADDETESETSPAEEEFGEEFTKYYLTFNKDYDYDNDGKTGTDSDREEYEKYFKPFVDEFDETKDYDGDGVADEDDRIHYDYVRSN